MSYFCPSVACICAMYKYKWEAHGKKNSLRNREEIAFSHVFPEHDFENFLFSFFFCSFPFLEFFVVEREEKKGAGKWGKTTTTTIHSKKKTVFFYSMGKTLEGYKCGASEWGKKKRMKCSMEKKEMRWTNYFFFDTDLHIFLSLSLLLSLYRCLSFTLSLSPSNVSRSSLLVFFLYSIYKY